MSKRKAPAPSMRLRTNAGEPYTKVDVLDASRQRPGGLPHVVAIGVDRSEAAGVWRRYAAQAKA